ncbi:hypothetical protein FZC66_16525 [Priestia megaterium]|nr:hypothetical protein FZC66_16525 [Priestia megaterium]
MKLIFRKNDSTTSLLLFVYNHYLALRGKDSIKLSSLLEYMRAFGKTDSAVRMGLSRAVKSGLLSNSKQGNEVFYSLTDEGKQVITSWNEGVMQFWERYRQRNEPWDGNWYIVNLHHAANETEGYAQFAEKIEGLGFVLINSNTWVSPYRNQAGLKKLTEEFGMGEHLIEFYGEMTIHQDLQQFLDDTFNISKLRSLYREYIDIFKPKFAEFQQRVQEEHFVEAGYALPLLNELGWNFFQVASNDIVLPRQLLNQWEEDEASTLFKEFREALLPYIHYFLNKFDS